MKIMNIAWKKKLQKMLDDGVNIMDKINDFSNKYDVSHDDIWDYVFNEYKFKPPKQCDGCKFLYDLHKPSKKCSRIVTLKDYYEKE